MKLKDVKKALLECLETNANAVFNSSEYQQILTGTMYALLKNTDYSNIDLCLFSNKSQTASTDGQDIYVSINGVLSEGVKTNEEKYLSHIGLLFHECGHLLYTNFKDLNELKNSFRDLSFLTPEELKKLPSGYDWSTYSQEICDMTNIIEDMYIENCLKMEYAGQVVKALEQNRETEKNRSESKETLERLRKEGKMSLIHGFNWLLHDYCNVHYFKGDEDWTELKRAKEVLEKIKPTIEKLKVYQEGDTKVKLLTSIAREMLTLLEKKDDTSYNKPTKNEEQACSEKKGGSLNSGLKTEGKKPQSKEEIEKQKEAKSQSKTRKEKIEDSNDAKRLQENFNDMLEELVKASAQKQKGNEEIGKALEKIKSETNKEFYVFRPNGNGLTSYKKYKKEVNPIIKQAVNLINNVLKTREEPDVETKLTCGGKVVVKDLWKRDGKCFSQYREGDETPDVAFGLVIDGSGSMGLATRDERMNGAVKAAITLKEMCKELKIPCAVISHSGETITNFATFEDDSDFTKIAVHWGSGGTCDSMGLYVMGEMLLQRPEKEKIMIIISDGSPNMSAFNKLAVIKKTKNLERGNPKQETKCVVKGFEKCGVQTYGIALYCYEKIRGIYEKNTIECNSLNELPKKLAKILKKAVLK